MYSVIVACSKEILVTKKITIFKFEIFWVKNGGGLACHFDIYHFFATKEELSMIAEVTKYLNFCRR